MRVVVAAALLLAHLGIGVPSAGAASADARFMKIPITLNGGYVPVLGAFDCDEGTDPGDAGIEETGALLYAPGSGADYLWTDLESAGGFAFTQTRLSISGTYTPIVGDFDGDRCDDILWYGAGSIADSVWWGGPTGFVKGRSLSISGTYLPVGGYFGGVGDGVYWYAPDGTEHLWLGTGNRAAPFKDVPARQVSGRSYRPVNFYNPVSGSGELLWHGPGSIADSVWRYHQTAGGMVVDKSTPVTLTGSYRTAGCGSSAVLHEPGTGADKLFTWNGSAYVAYDLTIPGSYRVAASGINTSKCTVLWHGPGTAPDAIWLPSTG